MPRPGEDDREALDRAFADLVAGYHLTADRPEPGAPQSAVPQSGVPQPAPEHRAGVAPAEERFVPVPTPLPRPAWPVLVAWLAMGYAVLAVLATALGAQLPRWVGWSALIGFVGGFGVLVTRLPRHRPPDAGDGAVL